MNGSRSASSLPAVYRSLVRAELMATAGYRANLVVGMLGWVVPFVMLALWRGAAGAGSIEGITAGQFTAYFGIVFVTTSFALTGYLIYDFSPLVHSGRLANYLLLPYHPFHNLVATGMARGLVQSPAVAVLFGVLVAVAGGSLHGGIRLPVALALWVAGVVAAAYVGALGGTIALWVTKSYGLQSVVVGLEGLLGGLYAPVALLPDWLEPMARHSPFWFQIGGPAELLSGILDIRSGLVALGEALIWIVVLHRVFRRVWRQGVRQYEVVGG